MARTTRDLRGAGVSRSPRCLQALAQELGAAEELADAGFDIPNRHRKRANPRSGAIPSGWDDLSVAGWRETHSSQRPED